jgi:hypothetical protein
MPYLETTSSSAVQDYVFQGDPSKAISNEKNLGFANQQM